MKTPAVNSARDFILAAKQSEIAGLVQLKRMGQLVVAVSQFIHMLQRERGTVNIYLCSQGQHFGELLSECGRQVLLAQRAVSDQLTQLRLHQPAPTNAARLYGRIAALLDGMATLDGLREHIGSRTPAQPAVMQRYCDVIRSALALVFEAADASGDPTISRALLAMFSFMQGKELAGQERALAAAGFAERSFDDEMQRRLLDLIEGQERCFDQFMAFADVRAQDAWRAQQAGDHSAFERFRRVACTGAIPAGEPNDVALSWFEVTTARIDGMKDIENRLEDILMENCQQNIAAAERALEHSMTLIDSEPQSAFYSVYLSCGSPDTLSGHYRADGINPQLGRSILELAEQQSRRLEQLVGELSELRASLSERKQIERAKGLLMQYRGMTEQQAHKTLRSMAMNQNKKLVDIAAAMLSVADILAG